MLIRLSPSATRDRRAQLGLTQDEVAERAGVSRLTVIKAEKAQNILGHQTVVARAIAHALECDLEEIAEGPPIRQERLDRRSPNTRS